MSSVSGSRKREMCSAELQKKLRRLGALQAGGSDVSLLSRQDLNHLFATLFGLFDKNMGWDASEVKIGGERKLINKGFNAMDLSHMKKKTQRLAPEAKLFQAVEAIVDKLEVKYGDKLWQLASHQKHGMVEESKENANGGAEQQQFVTPKAKSTRRVVELKEGEENPFAPRSQIKRTPQKSALSRKEVDDVDVELVQGNEGNPFKRGGGGLARTPVQARVQSSSSSSSSSSDPVADSTTTTTNSTGMATQQDDDDEELMGAGGGAGNPFQRGGGLARTPVEQVKTQARVEMGGGGNPFQRGGGLARTPVQVQARQETVAVAEEKEDKVEVQEAEEEQLMGAGGAGNPFQRGGGLARTPVEQIKTQPRVETATVADTTATTTTTTTTTNNNNPFSRGGGLARTPVETVSAAPAAPAQEQPVTPMGVDPFKRGGGLARSPVEENAAVQIMSTPALAANNAQAEEETATVATTKAVAFADIPGVEEAEEGTNQQPESSVVAEAVEEASNEPIKEVEDELPIASGKLDEFLADAVPNRIYERTVNIEAELRKLQGKEAVVPTTTSDAANDEAFLKSLATAREYQQLHGKLGETQAQEAALVARTAQLDAQAAQLEIASASSSSSASAAAVAKVNRNVEALGEQLDALVEEKEALKARLEQQQAALGLIEADVMHRRVLAEQTAAESREEVEMAQKEVERVRSDHTRLMKLWEEKLHEDVAQHADDKTIRKVERTMKRIQLYIKRYRTLVKTASKLQECVA